MVEARIPRSRAARGGRATILLAATFLLAGAAFDTPSLYVPATGLVLLTVALWAWVRLAARGTGLEPAGGDRSVVEGARYRLAVEVRRGWLPWPQARLRHPLMARALPLPPRFRGFKSVELRFPRRGRWRLEPLRIEITDPLGLHRFESRSGAEQAVLVLPRVEPVRTAAGAGPLPAELAGVYERGPGGGGLDMAGADFELDGLRPYRPGSAASRIHWPTAARRGELMEYRLASGGTSPPLVVLDGSGAEEELLDRAVRAAASLCRHLAGIDGCVLLAPGSPRPLRIDRRLGGWDAAHAGLALAGPHPPPPVRQLAASAEAVFWVSARGRAPAGLGAQARSGFLVSPRTTAGEAVFAVAGCHGYRIAGARPSRGRARIAA
jgi:uncharacterized protein (DUF58 family)